MRISRFLATLPLAAGLDINIASVPSLRNSSSTLAYNVLAQYGNNVTGLPPYVVGIFPPPTYWWHAGATWGALIDYWAYTSDTSYNPSVTQALLAQAGISGDLMPQQYRQSMGNDDIAFWAFTALAAIEYGLPFPNGTTTPISSWLQLADRVFNGMVSRWDTTRCGGGLKWQVYPENAGYNYKNSVSNGGFFQIAARLARYTGNTTYYDWAGRIWDWSSSIGLIDQGNFAVYDGSDDNLNCAELDHTQWTYNSALYLGGASYMYNATNGSSVWGDRALFLLAQANSTFFTPFPNSTGIVYEQACELRPRQTGEERDAEGGCNQDQLLFKGFLGRWISKAAIVAPFLAPFAAPLLSSSALGAGVACSGYVTGPGSPNAPVPNLGINSTICGQHFFASPSSISALSEEGYFSTLTVGQKLGHHLSALEMVQANLPLVDRRREQDGGPRTMRLGPGVTIRDAPATSAVIPTVLPSNTALGRPEGVSPNGAAGGRGGMGAVVVGMVGLAVGAVL
ncbi:Mannan endo-1,6-alpha-mannosidase-like protein [Elsinoe fawcettii]|nr:Mannan endo-1,6-alpha-mannosidase-like protein [Elsinoe fawcettii]